MKNAAQISSLLYTYFVVMCIFCTEQYLYIQSMYIYIYNC